MRAEHRAHLVTESAGAFAVVDANADLAPLNGFVDRDRNTHGSVGHEHPVEVTSRNLRECAHMAAARLFGRLMEVRLRLPLAISPPARPP